MPVSALLARAAESDALQQGAVVPDHRRLADDDPGTVVEEDPAAEARGRVDVDRQHLAHLCSTRERGSEHQRQCGEGVERMRGEMGMGAQREGERVERERERREMRERERERGGGGGEGS